MVAPLIELQGIRRTYGGKLATPLEEWPGNWDGLWYDVDYPEQRTDLLIYLLVHLLLY